MPADTQRTAPPSHLRPLPPKILPPCRSPWPIRSTFHASNTDRVPPAWGRMAAWHGALSCSRGVPGSRISRNLHVPSRPGYFPWPPPAAGHAVSYRVVGTVLVLWDAEHSAHLPVLLGSQWGAGHRSGAGRQHHGRLRWQCVSGHHSGRLAGRPGAGAGAHALLFRRGGHAGARGAGAGAGGGRADRRAGVHRAGQRGGEVFGQHHAGFAVRRREPPVAAGRRLLALLSGRQHRGAVRSAADRAGPGACQFPCRFRAGGHRHGGGPVALRPGPQRAAAPATAQSAHTGSPQPGHPDGRAAADRAGAGGWWGRGWSTTAISPT